MISNKGEGAGALTSSPSPSASPLSPRKAWQALAGDLKASWFFETSARSTDLGGSSEQPKNIRAFSSFSCRDNLQVGKHGEAHCPCLSTICLKKLNKNPAISCSQGITWLDYSFL